MFHNTKLIHLRAEVSGRLDRTATVATDPAPLGNHLRSMFTERKHLLACCTEARCRRLLSLILLHTLYDQDNHVSLSIIADTHLSDSKMRLDRLFQAHIAYQNGILRRGEEWISFGQIVQKLIDSLRQRLNLFFLSNQRNNFAIAPGLDIKDTPP